MVDEKLHQRAHARRPGAVGRGHQIQAGPYAGAVGQHRFQQALGYGLPSDEFGKGGDAQAGDRGGLCGSAAATPTAAPTREGLGDGGGGQAKIGCRRGDAAGFGDFGEDHHAFQIASAGYDNAKAGIGCGVPRARVRLYCRPGFAIGSRLADIRRAEQ